ncbi:MAG: ADP-glyceromanno-heptose 6-epimerase [Gemmataceae bacterium]
MIAITGAAGFIGSNLAHRIAAMNHDLLLVDHPLTEAKPANWVGLDAFQFLNHERFLTSLDQTNPQAIFHLGACSSTTETRWDYLEQNNITYTRTLWQWCALRGRPFIYASSAATYGDGSKGFDDRTPPTELLPLNLYGKSKNDFDIWALAEVAAGQPAPPKWAGLKFFNVYGPRESHKGRMASVVWQARRQIRETGEVKLFRSTDPAFPDGGQTRDFVFVNDCVDHMIWLWQSKAPNAIYNSGTGAPRTFHDLVTATFTAMNRPANIRFIDMPADLAGKYQNYTKAEMGKLRQAGYDRPATTLEDGVLQTVQWLERQPG